MWLWLENRFHSVAQNPPIKALCQRRICGRRIGWIAIRSIPWRPRWRWWWMMHWRMQCWSRHRSQRRQWSGRPRWPWSRSRSRWMWGWMRGTCWKRFGQWNRGSGSGIESFRTRTFCWGWTQRNGFGVLIFAPLGWSARLRSIWCLANGVALREIRDACFISSANLQTWCKKQNAFGFQDIIKHQQQHHNHNHNHHHSINILNLILLNLILRLIIIISIIIIIIIIISISLSHQPLSKQGLEAMSWKEYTKRHKTSQGQAAIHHTAGTVRIETIANRPQLLGGYVHGRPWSIGRSHRS